MPLSLSESKHINSRQESEVKIFAHAQCVNDKKTQTQNCSFWNKEIINEIFVTYKKKLCRKHKCSVNVKSFFGKYEIEKLYSNKLIIKDCLS